MRRSIETSGSGSNSSPQAKRAKLDQNLLPRGHSDQNVALIESLRRQSATTDSMSRLSLIPSSFSSSQSIPTNGIHDPSFGLLPSISRHLVTGHTASNFSRSQDDLLRILLLEQQIRNANSGFNLAATSQVRSPGLVDPSISQFLAQLRSFEPSTNISPIQAQLHRMTPQSQGLFSSAMHGASGRLNGSALNAQLALFNRLQQLPISNLRALQSDERIQSQLLATVNADISGPKSERPTLPAKRFLGYSHEGDRLIALAMDSEQWVMSEYQCLLRQQIVFVESTASASNNNGKTQGRNRPIVQGQVGILCRHCASLPCEERPRGAIYYPAKLHRIYQAAQNMAHNHFASSCLSIPEETRQKLLSLKEKKTVTVGAGKEYWYTAAKNVGIVEGEDCLFFCKEA